MLALQALIECSVRGLSGEFYTPAQIDAAMRQVFGVDTTSRLIAIRSALTVCSGFSR